ncbi:MAG TPA: alpha/beta hydrolase [Pyrinomonadaceae bacterium]
MSTRRYDSSRLGHAGHGNVYSLRATLLAFVCVPVAVLLLFAQPAGAQNLSFEEIERLPASPADYRIAYGDETLQFGDLRLPPGKGPHPVVIVIHGGCWYSEYDLKHVAAFSAALTRTAGVATWSLEYRRVGDTGGGWPGTFQDVARGADYLRVLARTYPLDLRRVVVVGHSAGGQLALWLAARQRLPRDSPLYSTDPLPLLGVVSLAGITDLRGYGSGCGGAVTKLLGGSPDEVPLRYRQASPIELLPLRVKQRLIHGLLDTIVPPEQSRDYEVAARRAGNDVKLVTVGEAGHFDLVAPQASAWPAVREAIRSLLKSGSGRRR